MGPPVYPEVLWITEIDYNNESGGTPPSIPPTNTSPGDINNDSIVTEIDYNNESGGTPPSIPPTNTSPGDINNDSIVDWLDILIVKNRIIHNIADDRADVNNDSFFDIFDLVSIARYYGIDYSCIDNDNDGYGQDCTLGPDCDDNDNSRNPGVVDVCGDGIDQDCDGSDEACPMCTETIQTRCECGGSIHETGFCCNDSWQANSCGGIIQDGCPEPMPEGMVLCYGFEDWTGNASTTPGYIFRISTNAGPAYAWDKQLDSTEVLSSCGGRTAHSGKYFFRKVLGGPVDSCLGTDPSENSYVRFGNGDAKYPEGSGDTTDLRTAITGEVMTVRFWMRLTGNWPPTGISPTAYGKFFRPCFGSLDYESDNRCGHLYLNANALGFAIYDVGTVDWDYFNQGYSIDDGAWHSISVVIERLNQNYDSTLTNPNYNMEFWVDDWDMEGSSTGAKDLYVKRAGTSPFRMIALWVNYGGSGGPTEEHAIEYDDFEIWDGLPVEAPVCTDGETQNCTTGQQGICSAGTQTCTSGSWGTCIQDNTSTTEICGNGIDEDCDGSDLECVETCPDPMPEGMVFCYDFEDWKGDIANTPGYPFGSVYSSYCNVHAAATEVVGSYEGLSPHSGSYMWLFQHGPGTLPTPVPGITEWAPNAHNLIGLGSYMSDAPNCGKNSFNIETVTTGEVFLRFYVATSNYSEAINTHDSKLKFIRYYEAELKDVIWYQNFAYPGLEPYFGLAAIPGETYYANSKFGFTDFDDWNWHKVSMYVNYNTGEAAIWWDVENESFENATIYVNHGPGAIEGGPTPSPLVLICNWSAINPIGLILHAIDDIEIWDRIPGSS
jgi:hypothetical protein